MARAITRALLGSLFTGFKTSFQGGFAGVSPTWSQLATYVASSTDSEDYGWLGAWPKIREWIGDRVINEMSASTYNIKNRKFETTVGVKADHIKDDRLGIYGPMFQELGRAVSIFPDELIYALLAAGATTKCYDGQYFFDTDHEEAGVGVSNHQGGAGTPWFLLDTSRALKPLIFQDREKFDFTALDNATDENVFMRDEFIYGSQGRANVGFGFWQMAYMSRQDLDADSYEEARARLAERRDDSGRKLGVKGTLLVVPGTLEGAGKRILVNQEKAGGGTNEWAGSAKLLVADQL